MTDGAITERLATRLDALSPMLKRAAVFLLEHPEDAATRSLRQIARQADIAPPTFSRLARAVGCGSYDELRELCRADFLSRSTRFADRAVALMKADAQAEADGEPLLLRHAAASVSGVQRMLQDIDIDALEAASERLADARRVALIGALSAAAFVEYAGYMSNMALPNWSVFGRNGSSMSSQIMDLGPEDAVIAISIAPYARRTVKATQLSRNQGAHVVALTDSPASPLAPMADARFTVSAASPQFFPSHVALLVLLESLVGMVMRRQGDKARRRIADVERSSDVLGEYWREESAA